MDGTDSAEVGGHSLGNTGAQLARHLCRLVDAVAEGIASIDPDGRCTLLNRAGAKILGYMPGELLGQSWHEQVYHSYSDGSPRPASTCPILAAARGEQRARVDEDVFWRKDGTPVLVAYTASPIEDEGVITGAVVTFTDLAELKRAERTATLQERNRLAGEIHDSLAQAFTGIVIQVGAAARLLAGIPREACEHLARADELAREGLDRARRSASALDPQSAEYADVVRALRRVVEQMTSGTPLRAAFEVHGQPYLVPPELGLQLVRIGQEALTNAVRHAAASNVQVELFYDTDQLGLQVQDDGRGFRVQPEDEREGFGLSSMRERARRIGAHLVVSSQPGQGTIVAVAAPMTRAGEGQQA